MAQVYCTGPVHIYVGCGSARGDTVSAAVPPRRRTNRLRELAYLGTCEHWPRIEIVPIYQNLESDSRGSEADDVAFMGEQALIFCELTRWNENVYARCASRPVYYQRRGTVALRDFGSLMVRNGLTYELILPFPYAAKPSMGSQPSPFATALTPTPAVAAVVGAAAAIGAGAAASRQPLPLGYRFPTAYLLGPDKFDPLGTKARKIHLVFHALRRRLRDRPGQDDGRPPGISLNTRPLPIQLNPPRPERGTPEEPKEPKQPRSRFVDPPEFQRRLQLVPAVGPAGPGGGQQGGPGAGQPGGPPLGEFTTGRTPGGGFNLPAPVTSPSPTPSPTPGGAQGGGSPLQDACVLYDHLEGAENLPPPD